MDIYEQHQAAFKCVSAFIIAKNGERVAAVSIQFPKNGASRLYAYVHWLGVPMVRGWANGYGYDKRSAAVSDASGKMEFTDSRQVSPQTHEAHYVFRLALANCDGQDWTRALENAGFVVWQAV